MFAARVAFATILLAFAGTALAGPEKVAANRDWVAVINDETLKKHAPRTA